MIEYKQLSEGLPIFISKLPEEIVDEVKEWVVDCKKYKDHRLSFLKYHDNEGKNHNSYQVGIPRKHIDNGFFLSYLLRLCEETFGGTHRDYRLRDHQGHFDGYDIWANFAYKGDDNPLHTHAGDLSGVLYVKNDNSPTIFPDYNIGYSGTENTLIIFPSDTWHRVETKQSEEERITVAFNIIDFNKS